MHHSQGNIGVAGCLYFLEKNYTDYLLTIKINFIFNNITTTKH